MKKIHFLFAALCFTLMSMVPTEVCQSDLFVKGTVVTTATYDEKSKLMTSGTSTIKAVTKTGTSVSADMHVVTSDAKAKETGSADVKLRCENGSFYMDMKNFAAQNTTRMGEDFTFEFEGIDMQYPGTMTVGQKLPDAQMIMKTMNKGTLFSTTTVKMVNRKVLAKESKTTKAGTFDCWKIEYNIDFEMAMFLGKTPLKQRRSVEWYTPKVGTVYSESYKEDKFEGHSEIISIKKGQ
ncbi:MAG: TapB family protein [Bacteroidia bacterium]